MNTADQAQINHRSALIPDVAFVSHRASFYGTAN